MKKLSDIELFERLTKSVQDTFLQDHSVSDDQISNWKGQDIVNFQEDLRNKTKAKRN